MRSLRSLDRILKRLRDAIANLLRLSSKGNGVDLDYSSLMTLSNASRVDAIRSIDALSRRLAPSSSSSRSRVSFTPPSASSRAFTTKHAVEPDSSRRRRKPSLTAVTPDPSKTAPPEHWEGIQQASAPGKEKSTRGRKRASSHRKHHRTRDAERPPPPSQTPQSSPQERVSKAVQVVSTRPRSPPPAQSISAANRISVMSFSSDSTKLGEIPERKWRSAMGNPRPGGEDGQDCYDIRPVFPLTPYYTVEIKERRVFAGFFRRRRSQS
ncbi:hypothetical protein VTJ83DRAFT_5867 [Remersonia thermophila]|uniref:Uncharacterized protein n=1 Tax=Remersonia thermophila TaxID=72144 RepID=A0ABR4D821_9PEZI